jgi:predicted exporter
MPPVLKLGEQTVYTVLDNGASSCYFIVKGNTENQLLQNEEEFCRLLDALVSGGKLKSYMASSLFIPSKTRQQRSYEAAARLLPYLDNQIELLGLADDAKNAILSDYYSTKDLYAGFDTIDISFIKNITDTLWLGEIKGNYYSCVLPLGVSDKDLLKTAAADSGRTVYFVDKLNDTNSELDAITRTMIKLLGAAYILIALFSVIRYNWKNAARIMLLPLFVVFCTVSILAIAKIPTGFFTVTAFILIFGLGLDYMYYTLEGNTNKNLLANLSGKAITLSFVTTALSFGALALSSFVPVQTFGIAVFSGLSAAFFYAKMQQCQE